jgi:hypothetical protein
VVGYGAPVVDNTSIPTHHGRALRWLECWFKACLLAWLFVADPAVRAGVAGWLFLFRPGKVGMVCHNPRYSR